MKRLASILLWLAACVFCFGQTSVITGTVKSPNGEAYQTAVSFLSKSTPVGISGNLVPTKITSLTATNGTFSQALFAGNYQVTIKGAPGANGWADSVFTIGVPTNAGTYDITALMTNVIGVVIYTSTNQVYNIYPSNNISIVTNGTSLYLSATASGGLGTNAYSLSLTGAAFGPLTVGANWLVVTNGRVGIGTNLPPYQLTLTGAGSDFSIDASGGYPVFRTGYNYLGVGADIFTLLGKNIRTYGTSGTKYLTFGHNDTDGYVRTITGGGIIFSPTNSERMRITEAGLVGISTNAPTTALEVHGTVKATAFSGDISATTWTNRGWFSVSNSTGGPMLAGDVTTQDGQSSYTPSYYGWNASGTKGFYTSGLDVYTNNESIGTWRLIDFLPGTGLTLETGSYIPPGHGLTLRFAVDSATIPTRSDIYSSNYVVAYNGTATNLTLQGDTIANGHVYPGGSTPFSQYDIGQVNNFWRFGYISNLLAVNINATTNTAEYFVGDGSLLTGVLTTNDVLDIAAGTNIVFVTNGTTVTINSTATGGGGTNTTSYSANAVYLTCIDDSAIIPLMVRKDAAGYYYNEVGQTSVTNATGIFPSGQLYMTCDDDSTTIRSRVRKGADGYYYLEVEQTPIP